MQMAVIPFEGANLISVRDESTGEVYVAINPIIDFFGLDRRGQRRKLERLSKEKGVDLKSLPVETKGGIQETLVININHLPAYLYSIQQSRVKPELREKLKRFQVETTKVINDYWNKGATINPRVSPADLKEVVREAISEYEKARTDLLTKELEKIKVQKAEVARRYVATLKQLGCIDERYIKRVAEYGVSILTGDIIPEKQQISVDEFLRSKRIYDKGARSSFGRFLAKFYKEKRGYKPKKSLSIVNGKETLTNYYTSEDLPLIEEAFKEWRRLKRMLSG